MQFGRAPETFHRESPNSVEKCRRVISYDIASTDRFFLLAYAKNAFPFFFFLARFVDFRRESRDGIRDGCKIAGEITRAFFTETRSNRSQVGAELVNLQRRARATVRHTTEYKICSILLPDGRARARSQNRSDVYTCAIRYK